MKYIGKEMPRVDGFAKVTGRAKYATEFNVANVAYGFLATSTIAKGEITALDTAAAERAPGVLKVITHENAIKPHVARDGDGRAPGAGGASAGGGGGGNARGQFYAFADNKILFNMQPIALVIAETYEQARHAARLVKATYRQDKPLTDVVSNLAGAAGSGPSNPNPRGDPAAALASAAVKIESTTTIPIEHHNPIELHGGIGFWTGPKLTIFNKSQNVYGDRQQIAAYFGMAVEDVSVVSLFVGGAFGSALAPHYYSFLLAVASKMVERPVKLHYTRRQMFTGHGYRPFYWQKVALGASADGKLQAIDAQVVINSSSYANFGEGNFRIARQMYACPNVSTSHKIVKCDLPTPAPMRAPGMVSNVTALEIAMDELAYALKIDPLELRLINYAETDPDSGKPFSSKALRECYKLAADKFGWSKRNPEPRSMRDGRLLVGWGMATGAWPALQQGASVRITFKDDGTALVGSATSDIGPGTYTVMTLIAAEYLSLPVEKVKFELGDTRLPRAPAQGGSFTTASVGTAIFGASLAMRKKLLDLLKKVNVGEANSPYQVANDEEVELADGALRSTIEPKWSVPMTEILKMGTVKDLTVDFSAQPSPERQKYTTTAHGAQFVEVKIDPDTGMTKVTRVIEATACGKIMNPLTSHSQEMGGVCWGIGMALHEATEIDHRYGRMMNSQLADYHVPTNADVHEVETMFVEEDDKIVNPLGVKGMGELGMVGIPAAIANAIFHATGKRVRDLPITPDKLIA
ncbi:MAG TPA: xanthine dehydrogenase family protein molybdopterin-binding subunit [Tepidisphaeraceae bacterium]|jgi:xanthine dehydrogenase YagR molybdenum-binding subunit